MSTEKFSIEEALGFGWRTMTGLFGTLMLYIFLPGFALFLVHLGINFAAGSTSDVTKMPFWYYPAQLVMWVVQLYVILGLLRVAVKVVDGQQPSWNDFASTPGTILNYIGASLLFGLAVGIGTVLLIVPGIIVYIIFHFFNFLIAEKNLGGITALGRSAELTKGARWKLFLFGLLCTVINIAGVLCLVVGVIPAGLVTFVAIAHVYRQLLKSSEAGAQPQVAT